MGNFIPGQIIKEFTTKKNRKAVIRYPKWEDLNQMLVFINEISQEDIYVTFSGETVTREGEIYYLSEMFKGMEIGDTLYLSCFIDNQFAGSCSILRDIRGRQRSYHVGIFGITIAKDFRGEGIGEEISRVTIEESKKIIPGLQILRLQLYSANDPARKLYEKLGFTQYGILPKGVWYRGDYIDEVVMYRNI